MFAKTFCRPGSHLCVVPVGLLTTLQYNAKGTLERIFLGYGDRKTNISSELFDVVKTHQLVRTSIPIVGGTTWIEGVFYTDTVFKCSGILPDCINNQLIDDIAQHPEQYTFYSTKVDSLAAAFNSVLTTRNWLRMAGFNLTPVYLISAGLNDAAFIQMVQLSNFPFRFPLISGYQIFDGIEGDHYHPLNLVEHIIKSARAYTDSDGYIKSNVITKLDTSHTYHQSDIITFNIQKASIVVTESSGKIIYSSTQKNDKIDREITCSYCGNRFISPVSGPVECSDPNCVSHVYVQLLHLTTVLSLPVISFDKFNEYVGQKCILCLTDIFSLPEYTNTVTELTLPKLLQSVIPVAVCSNIDIYYKIAALCNNSIKTFRYYIDNPTRLAMEFNNPTVKEMELINWLSQAYNASTITTLLDIPQLHIVTSNKKFDGAPIFRGKHIAITGRFKHGSTDEILSILSSYDGKVSVGCDTDSDCLVVGGLLENIDGHSMRTAEANNIYIYDEDTFFSEFDIDSDLHENLL